MAKFERPTYFYLFPEGSDINIVEMTDVQADQMYTQGKRWLDVGRKSLEEAQEVRKQLLSGQQ